MKSITKTSGGFDKVVFESVIDTLAGGATLEVTGFVNADGIVPAGTLVGRKDPSTGIAPIIKAYGSGAGTAFSGVPIGLTQTDIPIDPNTLASIVLAGVARRAALPAASKGSVGGVATLGSITGGASYTNGTYNGVALTGGTGVGATANITVSGGAVSAVTIVSRGTGYTVADALSAVAATIGGTGTGFTVPVASISSVSTTDAEFAAALPKITLV